QAHGDRRGHQRDPAHGDRARDLEGRLSVSGAPAAGATMRWASAASTESDTIGAARAVGDALRDGLGEGPIDLVVVFLSATHLPPAETRAAECGERLAPGCLVGASARGIVSAEHELEQEPALSAIAARLPGVGVHPFVLINAAWAAAAADPAEFARHAPHAA